MSGVCADNCRLGRALLPANSLSPCAWRTPPIRQLSDAMRPEGRRRAADRRTLADLPVQTTPDRCGLNYSSKSHPTWHLLVRFSVGILFRVMSQYDLTGAQGESYMPMPLSTRRPSGSAPMDHQYNRP